MLEIAANLPITMSANKVPAKTLTVTLGDFVGPCRTRSPDAIVKVLPGTLLAGIVIGRSVVGRVLPGVLFL